MPRTRNEIILGLAVPLLVLALLAVLAARASTPGVPIAFMAAVPMFAAMFTRALFTGIVALASVLVAGFSAAATYGTDFSSAIVVLVGVIIAAAAAVLASQGKPVLPRRAAPAAASAGPLAPSQPDDPVDALTGLPTRAGALPGLRESTETGPRVVAVIDCDHLATLNETHGRAIGDTFIFAVAGRTRWALPEEDLVARWDGEEFVVVAHGDPATTRPLLDLITNKVNKNPIRTDAGLLPQSMSVGAADWRPGESFDQAMERARQALYRAKAEGGARLVVADADS